MRASKRMKQVVSRAIERQGATLEDPELYVKIQNDPYMPLTIEKTWEGLLSVCHYGKDDFGDLYQDPEVVFLIGCDGEWYPIEIQAPHPRTGQYYRRYAEVDGHKGTFSKVDRKGQADLCTFCTRWANNLNRQGFAQ